mmetsp:Transcript_32904/g.60490  ORF Transcript_32904/g.60490 Transcript_32904/m.60490 type:complete len:137 (-) Transcript_32904:410-820(-)
MKCRSLGEASQSSRTTEHQSMPARPNLVNMALHGEMRGQTTMASSCPRLPQPMVSANERERRCDGTLVLKSWKMAGKAKPSATPMQNRHARSIRRPKEAASGVRRVVTDHTSTHAVSTQKGGSCIASNPLGTCENK